MQVYHGIYDCYNVSSGKLVISVLLDLIQVTVKFPIIRI